MDKEAERKRDAQAGIKMDGQTNSVTDRKKRIADRQKKNCWRSRRGVCARWYDRKG